uniref:DEP domain-containing protein 7-like isoform X2 n=1 Tax=Doryrhamphus excisus TaxID=161450 RepID=UPI0025AE92A5|nr:DEP domain-containing protein 7-like isoform X2 [Doryrhamphus excisus]
MASIKERAAALNLAEKLRPRPLVQGFAVKPAQCLPLASSLISHLRSTLKVKRRRVYLKSHNDCFLGTEAVDVVVEHITTDKAFEGATASRDKVMNVCQALLDCNVFDVVGTNVFGKKRAEFQDSKSALYRFGNENAPTVEDLERGVLLKSIQELFSGSTSERKAEQTFSSGSQCLMPTPVKFTQMSTQVPHLDSPVCASLPLETSMDNLNISPNRGQTHSVLPQSLVDEIWQEQTILRLLNLVELPLLEGVLQCSQISSCSAPSHSLPHNNPDLICSSSSHLDRQILKAFKDSQDDEWLCAALDCLDFLPDQPVVKLSRELPFLFPQDQQSAERVKAHGNIPAQSKLLLYGTLVRHYGNTDRPPLLPEKMTDVYTAITELIVNAKLDKALEALQLCLKLLPPNCREELRRLLHFMTVAGDTQGLMLEKEENRLVVKTSFSRAILNSKALSKEREDLMLVFMLSNIKEIFKIPGTLHREVTAKLVGLAQGKQANDSGCLVLSRTYTDCPNNTTNQELWILLQSIHLDTKISPKERKRLLRQFYSSHPEIFHKYFGESVVNVL